MELNELPNAGYNEASMNLLLCIPVWVKLILDTFILPLAEVENFTSEGISSNL